MRIKRYLAGAALIAVAVGYYLYKKRCTASRAGNGKGSPKKAAAALKKTAKPRAQAGHP
ncbi:MAG: hypothetical protein HY748_03380 [Elusimicrobia bacterium]|nr:hypothetical protein [Elusimicrobiota bacterium]